VTKRKFWRRGHWRFVAPHFTTDIFNSKRRYRNEKFSKNMRPCFCESGSALYLRIWDLRE